MPAFTFKEARAGEAMDPTVVGECQPDTDGIAGKVKCKGNDGTVAGLKLNLPPTYRFYNGRLISMLFLYPGEALNYVSLSTAFRERYGAPCASGTEKWQNGAGASLDNVVVTWCFKTGKLTLKAIGPSIRYGIVTYYDELTAPRKSAPVDF